ncbi:MAG: exonuclease subunit SbcD, partial [Calditrichota bacterium]
MTKPSDSPNQIRILHTADWHLGKRLERFSRLDEQRAILAEICDIAEREEVDIVCIAGDVFDTFNPPIEATEIFYKYVKRLANNGRRPVVAIAGNHDSPDRFETP